MAYAETLQELSDLLCQYYTKSNPNLYGWRHMCKHFHTNTGIEIKWTQVNCKDRKKEWSDADEKKLIKLAWKLNNDAFDVYGSNVQYYKSRFIRALPAIIA